MVHCEHHDENSWSCSVVKINFLENQVVVWTLLRRFGPSVWVFLWRNIHALPVGGANPISPKNLMNSDKNTGHSWCPPTLIGELMSLGDFQIDLSNFSIIRSAIKQTPFDKISQVGHELRLNIQCKNTNHDSRIWDQICFTVNSFPLWPNFQTEKWLFEENILWRRRQVTQGAESSCLMCCKIHVSYFLRLIYVS